MQVESVSQSGEHQGFALTSRWYDTEQLKYEHDRAVNRVVFGGASGSWLMSGGQDGQMKLWVRTHQLTVADERH